MIRLELKDYCHECVGFEADVERPTIFHIDGTIKTIYTDTIIRCKHRDRCAHVVKYVMEGYEENDCTEI